MLLIDSKGVFDSLFQICQILKKVDFAEMETLCSIKHRILQNSRFQIRPGENWVSS